VGGAGAPPENTLASFAEARRQGAPAAELDVRLCASGEVVVFHDADLTRMTAGSDRRALAACSLAMLRGVRVGSTGEAIPLLADVLAYAREVGLALNVELKHDGQPMLALAVAVARCLRRQSRADVLLSSFHPGLLAAAAGLAPDVPRALLTTARERFGRVATVVAPGPPLLQGLHLDQAQATPGRVAWARRRGLRVGVWTVNDPAVAARCVADGARWIITDVPAVVARALP
jgi:glycerophosphoryl diester phosphodiesterase